LKSASLSALGSADQGQCKVGNPFQVAPAGETGRRDHPRDYGPLGVGQSEETQLTLTETPVSLAGSLGFFGAGQPEDCLSESERNELLAGAIQSLRGGEFTEEASQKSAEVSMLVPWHSGDSVLDSGDLGGFVDGEPIPLEICFGSFEEEGVVDLPRQPSPHGMEVVPYADGEPISLDWKLAMEVGNRGGFQEADREMEIIMAFR
jgi:hypothetical protein